MPARYIIYGAGAIGGVIGGGLALGGHDVALIARGDHAAAMAADGLDLRLPGGAHRLRLPVATHPGELSIGAEDVVVLAMKTQHTADAVDALAATADADVAVVCAQNGVENERLALRRFANVYGMCVMLPGTHLEPGVVEGTGSPVYGVLDVGCYPGGIDDVAVAVAEALTTSGFRSQADEAVMRHKYGKLRVNTGNALDAACGWESRQSELAGRARREALAVYETAGIDVASAEEEAARREGFRSRAPVEGRGGSSSWQSLARGQGSIEADYLNGEIVLLGRLHGVATPVNEALRRIANRMAANGEEPGSVPLADVEALVTSLES